MMPPKHVGKLAIVALAGGLWALPGCGGGSGSHRSAITVVDEAPSNAICPSQVQVTVYDGSGSIIGSGMIQPTGNGCQFKGDVPTSKADEYVIALGSQPDSPSASRQTVSAEQLAANGNIVNFGSPGQ
jgi:hypothetical protein